jgi:hypothetical protein
LTNKDRPATNGTVTPGEANGRATDPDKILQTGLAFWPAKTLLSAIEIGVFSELSLGIQRSMHSGGGSVSIPARRAIFSTPWLRLVSCIARATATAILPETDLFLDPKKASYIGGILEMANARLYPFWGRLTEALRTGQPQNEVRTGGAGLFETLYADPPRLKAFLAAMTGISHGANMTIARIFPWKNYQTFVDVGTAQGDLAVQIALANPHLRGIGFDLPEVAPVFEEYSRGAGVSDRVSFVAGSFFDQDLPKADVVLMGHILHDWDLSTKKMLVRKAFEAVPVGGALVVYEAIIDDDRSKNAFRVDDEPEHADRDAWGLRLHRR